MSYRVQILPGSSYVQSEQNTKVKKYKKVQKSTKVLITKPIFELQTPDLVWKFIWIVQPNDKVQKVQKVQNFNTTKVQNRKVQKFKNSKNAKNDKNAKK